MPLVIGQDRQNLRTHLEYKSHNHYSPPLAWISMPSSLPTADRFCVWRMINIPFIAGIWVNRALNRSISSGFFLLQYLQSIWNERQSSQASFLKEKKSNKDAHMWDFQTKVPKFYHCYYLLLVLMLKFNPSCSVLFFSFACGKHIFHLLRPIKITLLIIPKMFIKAFLLNLVFIFKNVED